MLNYDNVVTVSHSILAFFRIGKYGVGSVLSFFSDSDSYHNNVVSMEKKRGFRAVTQRGDFLHTKKEKRGSRARRIKS